jgi:aspartate aminotransferase
VLTPCWLDCHLYLVEQGLTPVSVPLDARRDYRLDLDRIRDALTARTRAIVLAQPCNPTGRLFAADELRELSRLLEAHPARPLLISDECHREVVYAGNTFLSPARFYDETCVVYSYGKSLLMQGQRIGYVATSPRMRQREPLRQTLERLCRAMGFCAPTALMQLALRDLLEHRPDLARFAARRERLLAELTRVGYQVTPSQATFFLYARTPRGDDFEFAEQLASRGVLVLPAPVFQDRGSFRLSLTATDEMVERALPIFAELA